jgi:N-acyl-D-amino-acid deacylase
MFEITEIANQWNIDNNKRPIGPSTIIEYMLTQPLQHEPGSEYHYSNFGYCLLGRIIEEITREAYASYVQKKILEPIQVSRVRQSHSLWGRKVSSDEVHYYPHNQATTPSVFPPFKMVSWPYGGWCLENMDSHGRLGRFCR